jgi:MFS family permease
VTDTHREPVPFAVLPRNLAPLGYRDFALYWIGLAASNAGRWIEITGTVWLVYSLTDSPVLLGVLGIVRAIPVITLSPVAGVISDRFDQRRLLIVIPTLCLLASLSLGLLVASGQYALWQIYLQVFVQSAINAFDSAARQALFPRLVPHSRIGQAVTLSFSATRSAALVGPAIGGIAIARLGVAAPFFLNAILASVLVVAVVAMRYSRDPIPRPGTSFRSELTEGMRHLLRTPLLAGLFRLEIVFGVFQLNPVIIAIIGTQVLDVGPEGLGTLLAAPALGAITAIGCLIVLDQPRRQGRFVVYCQLAYAAILVVFAASTNMALSLVALAFTGLLDALASVARASVIQVSVPSDMRGRIMANVGIVTRGIGPLAQTQSGIVAGLIGGPGALVVAATALAGSATVIGRTTTALWRFDRKEPIRAEVEAASGRSKEASSA